MGGTVESTSWWHKRSTMAPAADDDDGNADETSSLLVPSRTDMNDAASPTSLDEIEGGYGTTRGGDGRGDGYATSETASSITHSSSNPASAEEGMEDGSAEEDGKDEATNERHTWLVPFFVNIFLACASFSIVMPSLTSYVLSIQAPLSFLPWVVSSYSVGEMVGSVAIGHYYEHATKTFVTPGRGPRSSLMACLSLGVVGSALYTAASWVEDADAAKKCLLAARLVQGVWTGGQQAVEQTYLTTAVHPSRRTEYTATLSTCAVLGFVTGPTIGALLSMVDTTVFGLPVTAENSVGVFMVVGTSLMLVQTALFFDGKDVAIIDNDEDGENTGDDDGADASSSAGRATMERSPPFNCIGASMCLILFYVHFYSFAVQETIVAPLAMLTYRWDLLTVNSLFAGAGILSLITAFVVRYLTRCVGDRALLMASLFLGFLGSAFLLDKPFNDSLPVWRFLLGYGLVTIAFPVGRNVVLGLFGNVLGGANQGRWTGVIFAVGAIPRVTGPFASLELLVAAEWRTWLEFGITTVLFGVSLLATWKNSDFLVPYEDFAAEEDKRLRRARSRLRDCHSPVPSPILGRNGMQQS